MNLQHASPRFPPAPVAWANVPGSPLPTPPLLPRTHMPRVSSQLCSLTLQTWSQLCSSSLPQLLNPFHEGQGWHVMHSQGSWDEAKVLSRF